MKLYTYIHAHSQSDSAKQPSLMMLPESLHSHRQQLEKHICRTSTVRGHGHRSPRTAPTAVAPARAAGSLKALLCINLTTIPGTNYYYCPPFSDENSEALRALPAQSQCQEEGQDQVRGPGSQHTSAHFPGDGVGELGADVY